MSDDASAPAPEPAPAEDAKDAKQPLAAQAVDDDEQVPYAERLAQEEERCDAAKVQLEVVKARTEEVHEQLRFYTGRLNSPAGAKSRGRTRSTWRRPSARTSLMSSMTF